MFSGIIKYPLKSVRRQQAFILAGAFFTIFSGILIAQSLKPAEAKDSNDSEAKIVTVFENGEKTAFKTTAKTVGEALKKQDITLAKEDNVEPALTEELTDSSYNINIYRAAPYLVVDGNSRIKIMTAAKTSKKIAEAAGLKIYDEDIITTENSENPLEDGVATFLSVKRAKILNVKLFGKQETIRTQAKTISDFLKEKKIKLGAQDGVSKNLNSQIIDGDSFEIWRNGKQTISVEEEIAFSTEKIEDASKDSSYKEVREKGENGKKTVVYEIEMKNGQEVSRVKISEVEIKAAKKQVEVVGTKIRVIVPEEHQYLMAQAGISSADFESAEWIINKESHWRINATNSLSGAYGLCQALPGGKMSSAGSDWQTNPITQLKWCSGYAKSRYGGWAQAYAAWQRQHWW